MNVFFLKQVISALMISVNLHYFSSIHCLLAFSTNPFITHWRLKRRKTYERLVLSFYIVSFVLNVIVFVRNGLKQTKANRLFQIPFFEYELATILVTFVCIFYFDSQIFINLTRDTFLVSRGKKKLTKVCIYKFDHSILNWQNNTQVFFDKSIFSDFKKIF